jgi:hypothetical protein
VLAATSAPTLSTDPDIPAPLAAEPCATSAPVPVIEAAPVPKNHARSAVET